MSSDWLLGGVMFVIYAGIIVFYNVSHRRRKQKIEETINKVRSYEERFDPRYVRAGNLIRTGTTAIGEYPRLAHDVLMDLHEYCLDLIIERGLSDGEEQASSEGAQEVAKQATRREKTVAESPEPEEGHPQDG